MIEQTPLVINEWHFHPPALSTDSGEKISQFIDLEVMKKRAADKKGIACRFTSSFTLNKETLLEYVAEDSYVIDLEDIIDKSELLRMIRNSYSKFIEKFDFRKMGTILQSTSLTPLDEKNINLDAILHLLEYNESN